MRLVICGSRSWTDPDPIEQLLHELDPRVDVVIHGDCRGADRIADGLARRKGFAVEVYPANWRGQGRGAGMRRNLLMLREGRPDVVYAFKADFDHTLTRGGTENMVALARKAGVPATVIES